MPKIEVRLLFAQDVEIEVSEEELNRIRNAESEYDFNAINSTSVRAYEAANKQSGLDLDWSISDALVVDDEGVPTEELKNLLD